jgi:hypothetical protein
MTKQFTRARCCFLLLSALALAVAGCSSIEPNPTWAAANTGYVDFHCDTSSDLSWDVYRVEPNGKTKKAFSQYKPLPGNVLRVTAKPGEQRYRVGIFNRVTEGPEEIGVTVEDGKVTPVKVTLVKSGTVTTQDKSYSFRGSAKGYARGAKFSSEENPVLDITLQSQPSVAYEPKEKMPYSKKE